MIKKQRNLSKHKIVRQKNESESDQKLAFELIKKLVLAWDPDYTKVTPYEAAELAEAEKNLNNGDYVTDSDINWE